MTKFIELAINKALQSSSTHKVSAIGLNAKGELLGAAFNSPRFSRHGGGNHAEMALLKRYGKNVRTIILCRTGKSGDILPIEPCSRCSKVLKKLGIKVYTVKDFS